jgi:hypothetical protein
MTRIDLTAASDREAIRRKFDISPVTSAPPIATDCDEIPANPNGLNLHAFTHCPDCKSIMHRETGCTQCRPEIRMFG